MAKKKTDESIVKEPDHLGVFVGLIAVDKRRYEVAVLRTKGGEVTEFLTPYLSTEGSEIHIALRDLNSAIQKYIRTNPAKLWEDNTELNPPPVE